MILLITCFANQSLFNRKSIEQRRMRIVFWETNGISEQAQNKFILQ